MNKERERIIEIIRNSRTGNEKHSVGAREHNARLQAIADILLEEKVVDESV